MKARKDLFIINTCMQRFFSRCFCFLSLSLRHYDDTERRADGPSLCTIIGLTCEYCTLLYYLSMCVRRTPASEDHSCSRALLGYTSDLLGYTRHIMARLKVLGCMRLPHCVTCIPGPAGDSGTSFEEWGPVASKYRSSRSPHCMSIHIAIQNFWIDMQCEIVPNAPCRNPTVGFTHMVTKTGWIN